MTFSEFAKVLYPYLGKGETERDYLIRLTDKIMSGRPGRAHSDGGYQNPLRDKDDRCIQYYFSGKRSVPNSDIGILLPAINKEKFAKYIDSQCSKDALKMLANDLSNLGQNVDYHNVSVFCAELFATILHKTIVK